MWLLTNYLECFVALDSFKISCVLEAKLGGFGGHFGAHVGCKIAPCWVQEAQMSVLKLLFGGCYVASFFGSKSRPSNTPFTRFAPPGGGEG